MPTSHPRHSITETPELAAVLDPLRDRLGPDVPTLGQLALLGAKTRLRELEAQDRASRRSLETFVQRLAEGPEPDLDEVHRIRHSQRQP